MKRRPLLMFIVFVMLILQSKAFIMKIVGMITGDNKEKKKIKDMKAKLLKLKEDFHGVKTRLQAGYLDNMTVLFDVKNEMNSLKAVADNKFKNIATMIDNYKINSNFKEQDHEEQEDEQRHRDELNAEIEAKAAKMELERERKLKKKDNLSKVTEKIQENQKKIESSLEEIKNLLIT